MKELRDQTAHVLAAVFIFAAFTCGGLLGAAFAGFLIGMVREVTEEGAVVTLDAIKNAIKSWKDLLFWSIGGLLAKVIF